MDKLCRICMLETDSVRLLSENCFGESRTLFEALTYLTNMALKLENGYPKHICDQCETFLCLSDSFKRRCIENEEKLTRLNNEGLPYDGVVETDNIKSEKVYDTAVSCSSTYQCPICYVKFQNGVELNSHRFAMHSNNTNPLMVGIFPEKSEANVSEGETESKHDGVKEEVNLDAILDGIDEANHYEDDVPFIETDLIYSCHNCDIKFPNKKIYEEHNKKVHVKVKKKVEKKKMKTILDQEDEYLSCDKCDIKFRNLKSYKTHIWKKHRQPEEEDNNSIETNEKIHECNVCMRKFAKKTSLAIHLKKHETKSSNIHVCLVCKREFKHQAHLDNHILSVHTTNQGLKCDFCDLYFASQESLDLHKSVHSIHKKHQCNMCSKAFNMLSTLKDHLRVHTGEKPFLCPMCGKGFSQNTNLIEHLRRHQGIKPFKCEACDRRFVSKGELAAHTRKHSGAHPFVCTDCGNGFTTSSSLVKHRRTHTGERPYACDLCPMRFAASGTLKNHRRTHTGEKPHKCQHCDKAFVQKNDLVSHTRCHTGERPYQCTTCGQAFRQSSALKTHWKLHQSRTPMPRRQLPISTLAALAPHLVERPNLELG